MPILLGAFTMIFLAEMGDKSQLLSFSLTSCYRGRTILLAVFVGTLINNGAAVFLGFYLGEVLNMELVTLFSAMLFIGFGIWTFLNRNEEETEVSEKTDCSLGSFLGLVSLFVFAEMGDKTQIATAVYAANYNAPFLTLGGVLAGMLLADGLGIYLGCRLRDKTSNTKIGLLSSLVFFALGIISVISLIS